MKARWRFSELQAMQDAMIEGDWLPDLDTEVELVTELLSFMHHYYELNDAITWDTTCLNCASLLDQSYDQYVRLAELTDGIRKAQAILLDYIADEIPMREIRFRDEVYNALPYVGTM